MGENVVVHKVQSQYAAGQHIGKALRRIENEIDVCQENIAYYEKRLFDYHENDLSHHYEDTLRWYEDLKVDRLSGSSDAEMSGGKGKLRNFMVFCGSFMRGAAATVIATAIMTVATAVANKTMAATTVATAGATLTHRLPVLHHQHVCVLECLAL